MVSRTTELLTDVILSLVDLDDDDDDDDDDAAVREWFT